MSSSDGKAIFVFSTPYNHGSSSLRRQRRRHGRWRYRPRPQRVQRVMRVEIVQGDRTIQLYPSVPVYHAETEPSIFVQPIQATRDDNGRSEVVIDFRPQPLHLRESALHYLASSLPAQDKLEKEEEGEEEEEEKETHRDHSPFLVTEKESEAEGVSELVVSSTLPHPRTTTRTAKHTTEGAARKSSDTDTVAAVSATDTSNDKARLVAPPLSSINIAL